MQVQFLWRWSKKNGITAVAVLLGILFLIFRLQNEEEKTEEVIPQKEKSVDIVVFWQWQPEKHREVLGTIESDQETAVQAEVAGTVENVLVKIGEFVSRGTILATFTKQNDTTQINYENTLQNLQRITNSTENSVQSAKIALETAKRDLAQTKLTENQSHDQALELLKNQSRNSETLLSNVLNWMDRILGASNKYRYETVTGRYEIGAQNRIGKQDAKNQVEDLVRKKSALNPLPDKPRESDILNFAKDRLTLVEKTKATTELFDQLIHGTPVTDSFSDTTLSGFKTQSATYLSQLNTEILSLENQIETTKSGTKRMNLALASGENRIRSAEASLQVAQSNAEAQVQSAENQLRLAQNAQKDLVIRAPFAGKITEKRISIGNQISPGQKVFSIVNESAPAKVVAYFTSDELEQIAHVEKVQIHFENGATVEVTQNFASVRIDPRSQKTRIEFPLKSLPEGIFIGNFVKVALPINGVQNPLLPISAISFEPDGAEVLIVNETNTTERKKVKTGKIIANAVEITEGLESGEKVVRFRNQVFSGEKVQGK